MLAIVHTRPKEKSYVQLRATQTVAYAHNRSGHLVTKMIDHMDHIAAMVVPGSWNVSAT